MKISLSRIASLVAALTALAIPVSALAQQEPEPNSPADGASGTPPHHKKHKKHHENEPEGSDDRGPEKEPEDGARGKTPEKPDK